LIGIAAAWWFYVGQPGTAASLAKRLPRAYEWSLHKFYIDEFYNRFIVRPLSQLSVDCGTFDREAIDRTVDWVGNVPAIIGSWFRRWQTGLIQSYAALMFLGVTILAACILLAT
jgi:NADH:ubiquinone oxidoreductase subunit 5 (subunit L)/multisubunit Na+/H+ antiporter MnhA subunit